LDGNLIFFEEVFIPLLKEAKARGLEYRVEQCPMPGWTTGDNFHNNIGYTPALWIALHRICEKHGVGDQLRVHYDPSHAILTGQDTRSIFQYLKDELDIANTALVIEHEYPRARIQDKQRLKPILKGSIAFARKIDEAAGCTYALHHEVLPAQDIPVLGKGRVPYWT
jgi:hypothetical protein